MPSLPLRRRGVVFLTLGLLHLVPANLRAAPASPPPNIVFVIADDIGYNDLGCYGSPNGGTPRLDQLAQRGLRFSNAILTASSCSPSRSSIITGRYPHNTGAASELHQPISGHLPSIAGLLREAGYYTALAGKNHMTWSEPASGLSPPTPPWNRTYPVSGPGNDGGHAHWLQALDEAPPGQPFFLWLASIDAHRDWDGDRQWDEQAYGPRHDPDRVVLPPALRDTPTTRADFASYLNEVTRFDHFVGKVVDWIDAHPHRGPTWLVVMSDNGRPFPRAKTRLHDDGMKSYLLVTGPDVATPGAMTDVLVSALDLAPTFANWARIDPGPTFQGHSFAAVLTGSRSPFRDYAFSEHNWHDYEAHGRSVRDGRWLFIRNQRPRLAWQGPADSVASPAHQDLLAAQRTGNRLAPVQADVLRSPRPTEELYDTRADPNQVSNLAGDPAHHHIERRLAAALDRWIRVTGDSAPAQLRPDFFDRTTGRRLDPPPRPSSPSLPAGADHHADRINSSGK